MDVEVFLVRSEDNKPEGTNQSPTTPEQLVSNLLDSKYNLLNQTLENTPPKEGVVPVILCEEDFWQGHKVGEITKNCIPQEKAFEFFQNQMQSLSEKHPKVLIAPGSVYLSTPAIGSTQPKYFQDNYTVDQAEIYVQNVAPVFYGGELIRLIKKGECLTRKSGQKNQTIVHIETERDFEQALQDPTKKITVPSITKIILQI